MEPKLLTAEELVDHLRVQKDTVYRWTRAGKIPSIRLGGRLFRYELDKVLASPHLKHKASPDELAAAQQRFDAFLDEQFAKRAEARDGRGPQKGV